MRHSHLNPPGRYPEVSRTRNASGQGLWSQLWSALATVMLFCPQLLPPCLIFHLHSNVCIPYSPKMYHLLLEVCKEKVNYWAFRTTHWLNMEMHRFSLLVHLCQGPLNTEIRLLCFFPQAIQTILTYAPCHTLPTPDSSLCPALGTCFLPPLQRHPWPITLFLPDTTGMTVCLIVQMCLSNSVLSDESGVGSHALVTEAQIGCSVKILICWPGVDTEPLSY